ncbi:hypothetical protein [Mesorhizobium sp. M0011]|uniref:hypothetical protein n=1 Tax=Mesorhizobium sp. M0011 TaxID=2956839 RepID=UPI00333B84EC
MPNSRRVTPALRKITERNDLIDLLVQEVKSSPPQIDVPDGFIEVFDVTMDEFRINGCHVDLGNQWSENLANSFGVLANSSKMVRAALV